MDNAQIKPVDEIPLTYSVASPPSLMRRVQKRANQKYDGNRSKMVNEYIERGLAADAEQLGASTGA